MRDSVFRPRPRDGRDPNPKLETRCGRQGERRGEALDHLLQRGLASLGQRFSKVAAHRAREEADELLRQRPIHSLLGAQPRDALLPRLGWQHDADGSPTTGHSGRSAQSGRADP